MRRAGSTGGGRFPLAPLRNHHRLNANDLIIKANPEAVVQDVPNLRAHVESRAQWPLWLFLAVVAAVAGWWAYLGPGHQHSAELRREAMLVSARSFANGLSLAVISPGVLKPWAEMSKRSSRVMRSTAICA